MTHIDVILKSIFADSTCIFLLFIAFRNIFSKYLYQADTGSGKTFAFIVPALIHILACPLFSANCPLDKEHRELYAKTLRGPIALVMAPTRELASQIHEAASKLTMNRLRWFSKNKSHSERAFISRDGCLTAAQQVQVLT